MKKSSKKLLLSIVFSHEGHFQFSWSKQKVERNAVEAEINNKKNSRNCTCETVLVPARRKHLKSSLQSIFVILRWRTVGTPHRGTFARLHWSSVEEEARASYCWNLDPPHRLSPEHHRLISVLHFNISIPSIPQLNGPSRSPQSTYLRILFVFADKFWSTTLLPNTQQIQELTSSNSINSWNENRVNKKG